MRMRSRDVVIAVVLASAYAACTHVLAPISFWLINVRVANALRCFAAIFGWPAVVGLAVGILLANIISPLGAIDLLSPLVVGPSLAAIYLLRRKSVLAGFAVVFLTVSLWVSFMISIVAGMPFLTVFAFVAPGVFVSDVILPYALLRAILRVMPSWDWRRR